MAARMRTVNVQVELLDHDHGHWCNDCMLGTGVRVWDMFTAGARSLLRTWLWCTNCGGRNIIAALDGDAYHC